MRRKQGALIPIEVSVLEAILSLFADGTEAAHGFLIAKIIHEATGARSLTAHGTLYRALHRLENAGLVDSSWEDPRLALEEGRPTRRLYRVTGAGELALAREKRGKVEENATPSTSNPGTVNP